MAWLIARQNSRQAQAAYNAYDEYAQDIPSGSVDNSTGFHTTEQESDESFGDSTHTYGCQGKVLFSNAGLLCF
jgi:hypothetical protein